MIKDSRNYGVDLLRIVSMLGVVTLHILGHGGLLDNAGSFFEFSALYFLQTLVQPAVDCFILISGYVGYKKGRYYPRLKNIISLFFVVLFYSISITLVSKLICPDSVGTIDIIKACMPIISQQYWFFTSYVGLFILSPLLNVAVHHADKKQMLIFTIVLAICCCFSRIKDPFAFDGGFSVIWLALLYLLGALMKKHDLANALSKKAWALIATSFLVLTWTSKIAFSYIPISFVNEHSSILLSNTSPTVVIMACSSLCLFSKTNCKETLGALINFLSASAFSIYLIHDNIFIRTFIISRASDTIGNYHPALTVLFVLCGATLVSFYCILIDNIRILLFRFVRINKLSENIEIFIKRIINKLYFKLN